MCTFLLQNGALWDMEPVTCRICEPLSPYPTTLRIIKMSIHGKAFGITHGTHSWGGGPSGTSVFPSQSASDVELRCDFLLVWIVYWTTSRVTGYFRRHDTCVMSLYCHTVHVCCDITYSRWNMQLNRVALWVWVQSIPKLILQQTSGTRGLLVVVSCIVFCFGQYWSIYPYTSGSVFFGDGLRFQD